MGSAVYLGGHGNISETGCSTLCEGLDAKFIIMNSGSSINTVMKGCACYDRDPIEIRDMS